MTVPGQQEYPFHHHQPEFYQEILPPLIPSPMLPCPVHKNTIPPQKTKVDKTAHDRPLVAMTNNMQEETKTPISNKVQGYTQNLQKMREQTQSSQFFSRTYS